MHEKLIKEFVDSKLNILVKEISQNKDFELLINSNKEIVLNRKIIGKIIGIQAKLYELETYKKNLAIYNSIIDKVRYTINQYLKTILKNKIFKLTINENLEVFFKEHKIASIYKGVNILEPKLMIANNQFITKENYNYLKEKIQYNLSIIIKTAFKEQNINIITNNQNLKAIIFSLQENLGVVKISAVEQFFKSLKSNDLITLKKNNINISSNFIYYNFKVFDLRNKINRWILVNLFLKKKELKKFPNKKIFLNKFKLSSVALKALGFIKLDKFVIEISFLEYIFDLYLSEKKEVYQFNFYHIRSLKIPFSAFYEILRYFNFRKIVGTNFLTFWKKIEKPFYKQKQYDVSSPFYILKKLQ